jgi:hypothetical protein
MSGAAKARTAPSIDFLNFMICLLSGALPITIKARINALNPQQADSLGLPRFEVKWKARLSLNTRKQQKLCGRIPQPYGNKPACSVSDGLLRRAEARQLSRFPGQIMF